MHLQQQWISSVSSLAAIVRNRQMLSKKESAQLLVNSYSFHLCPKSLCLIKNLVQWQIDATVHNGCSHKGSFDGFMQ